MREGAILSQAKRAEETGSTQSSVNRYENGQSEPIVALFRTYADYFDVSMDYIFTRTDNPQMRQFIEICFDPDFPVSEKMRGTLLQLMAGEDRMRAVIYARYSSELHCRCIRRQQLLLCHTLLPYSLPQSAHMIFPDPLPFLQIITSRIHL